MENVITAHLQTLIKGANQELNSNLPRRVGVKAVNLFKENFRRGGFMDGGLHPWQKSQRERGGGADASYPTLTSRRNHLMNSLEFIPAVGMVTIRNTVPYARLHNEGGHLTTHPTVTPAMRRMAWAKAYQLSGVGKGRSLPKELPPEAQKWKALALTKKTHLTIRVNMPKRQFMGDSQELQAMVKDEINKSIQKIANGINHLPAH